MSEIDSYSIVSESVDERLNSLQLSDYSTEGATDETLARFYKNNLFTDVEFHVLCGEGYIPFSCHQLVLSLWSPCFESQFYSQQCEFGKKTVEISDIAPSAFEVLIEYCYGSTTLLKRNRNDVSFLLKVFKAAQQYKIKSLTVECIKLFSCIVPTKDNVFTLLDAAYLIDSEGLKLKCLKVMQTQTNQILSMENIHSITHSVVDMVLGMSSLSLKSEYDLISWLFEWGNCKLVQLKERDNVITLGQIIEPYLPRLNFLSLSPEQFGLLVVKYKEYFNEKDGFAIFMNIVNPGSWPLPAWCKDSQDFSRQYIDH